VKESNASPALTNFGVNSVKRPSMSSITGICPSQAGQPPIPIVGTATAAVSSRARLSATPSMTRYQHRTKVLHRVRLSPRHRPHREE
jgi:hypothetical protein